MFIGITIKIKIKLNNENYCQQLHEAGWRHFICRIHASELGHATVLALQLGDEEVVAHTLNHYDMVFEQVAI